MLRLSNAKAKQCYGYVMLGLSNAKANNAKSKQH